MNSGSRLLIEGMLRSVLHRKLEELVLDTMDHPETLPTDILEHRNTAREYGFDDILAGIDEIFREVGEIQVIRKIQRIANRRQRRLEQAMQDFYIANDGAELEQFEKGLCYVRHEKVTRAGRLDIFCTDQNGGEVLVELKAQDYDVKNTYRQVMGYFEERRDARLFFAAHKVDPRLFFPLRSYQEEGRMRFFEVEDNNGRYTAREVHASDFPEPREIDWSTRRRVTVGDGLVRVTSNGPAKIRSTSQDTAIRSFADAGIENHPFYYQAMWVLAGEYLEQRDYLQPIAVPQRTLRGLQKLSHNRNLESLFETYIQNEDLHFQSDHEKSVTYGRGTQSNKDAVGRGRKKMGDYMRTLEQESIELYKELQSLLGFEGPDVIKGLDDLARIIETYTKSVIRVLSDPDISETKRLMGRAIKRNSPQAAAVIRSAINEMSIIPQQIVLAYLNMKLARTKALLDVDEGLATAYFRYYTITHTSIDPPIDDQIITSQDNPLIPKELYKALQRENELYQSMLSILIVEEESSIETDPLVEEPVRHTKTPAERLAIVITSAQQDCYSDSMRHRIIYFAEDAADAGLPLDELESEFRHFKLSRRMRRRETALNDLQLQNFFDDIHLQFTLRGDIPKAADMERLYESALSN